MAVVLGEGLGPTLDSGTEADFPAITFTVTEKLPREGGQDERWKRTYTRTFLVRAEGASARRLGPKTIRGLNGIPQIGQKYATDTESDASAHVGNTLARCTSAGPNPEHSDWDVTVNYGMMDPGEFPQNPLEWPIRLEWDFIKYEKVVEKSIHDNPIVNSANDPFKDPVTRDDSRQVLTITRNEPTYDPAVARSYADKINSNTFLGHPPQYVKVLGAPGRPVFNQDAGGWYWEVKYVFEFANTDPGWAKSILDQGYNYLDPTTKNPVPITNKGQKTDDPSLLDGDGNVLPAGEEAVYIEFDVYEELDFSVFGFDFSNSTGGDDWPT